MARTSPHSRFFWLPLPLWLAAACAAAAAPAEHPGAVIYKKMCQECHGAKGQGVKDKYDDPLTGDLTLDALARKIERTMPEDKEGTCVGEDAKQVAAYIYESFYSAAAQARSHPPEQDLSRLTIAQYRSSVMDLIGRFRMGPGFDRPLKDETGLKATYRGVELPKPGEKAVDTTPKNGIKAKRPNYKLERVDPQVAFHFGADSPDKEKMEAEQFQDSWSGSVVAQETGVYEFMIRTENGARLWINDMSENDALIDAWVSAGPKVREEKKSLYLIGGHAYALRLDHFKFKEQSASIELWWTPPHGTAEIIPQHALRTERPRELMVVRTSFPADDRSVGYERGTSISKAWDQATTEAAISVAEDVVENLNELAGTKDGAPDRADKLRKFAFTFVEAAFCRPLTEPQKQLYIEAHFKGAKTPEQAVKRVVLFTLKSPQFLYPELREMEKPDDFAYASRLALTLWDSIPDKRLIQAAAAGKLRTPEQIRAEAQRMLPDPRTKAKLHGFFHQWLELERAEGNIKDMKLFPGFDESVLADLRESLFEFLDQVVWSPQSDYRQLLQADYLLLNDRLGKFYGKPVQGGDFQRVEFDPKQRAGVVTHPYLLASLATSRATSPIHRGVFLTRNIVGLSLRPPPKAVTFDESHFNPKLTMREKITELTKNNACMSCHSTINPLGFSLENYDAIGRWRTQDNHKPVNAVGDFADDEGRKVHLTGPRDIVNYVSGSTYGHRAFIRQMFNHFVKQQPLAYGPQTLEDMQKSFAASNCNVQKLIVDITMTAVLNGKSWERAGE
jgi:mono/diheme cytochrome c family protein